MLDLSQYMKNKQRWSFVCLYQVLRYWIEGTALRPCADSACRPPRNCSHIRFSLVMLSYYVLLIIYNINTVCFYICDHCFAGTTFPMSSSVQFSVSCNYYAATECSVAAGHHRHSLPHGHASCKILRQRRVREKAIELSGYLNGDLPNKSSRTLSCRPSSGDGGARFKP